VTDTQQDVVNPTLTYDSGVLTFTFQRERNTNDPTDWRFSDLPEECLYFMFPVGGGPHFNTDFERHSATPRLSDSQICISE